MDKFYVATIYVHDTEIAPSDRLRDNHLQQLRGKTLVNVVIHGNDEEGYDLTELDYRFVHLLAEPEPSCIILIGSEFTIIMKEEIR